MLKIQLSAFQLSIQLGQHFPVLAYQQPPSLHISPLSAETIPILLSQYNDLLSEAASDPPPPVSAEDTKCVEEARNIKVEDNQTNVEPDDSI